MSTVGENILYMRKRLGMTQEELATKMGYKSKSTINKIEMGINDIPQRQIVKFAEVLGTTPAHLMGWITEEQKNPPTEESDLTDGEKMWLELYHRISGEAREVLIAMMESFDKVPTDKQLFLLDVIRASLKNQK